MNEGKKLNVLRERHERVRRLQREIDWVINDGWLYLANKHDGVDVDEIHAIA